MDKRKFISAFLCLIAAASCSTTKVLQDGEYRLAKNKIVVEGDKSFNTGKLDPYIKQKANTYFIFGWNPFLNIYNWSNGKGKGWDKFVQKIGVAPVVYEPDLVDKSITSMEDHLDYLGYYNSHIDSEIRTKKRRVYVTYKVRLGKRYPIEEIQLNLPEKGEFTEAFLKDTAEITIKKGDFLSEAALEAETERVATKMRNQGFYSFNKNYFSFQADTIQKGGKATLQYNINEFTRNQTVKEASPINRFYIDKVDIEYPANLRIRKKILRELTTITPGSIYGADIVNSTYSRLSALKVFSSVNIGMTQSAEDKVDCRISLAQSKLQGFKVNLEASTNSSGLFGISPQISYYHKNVFHGGELLNLSFMGNFQFKFKSPVKATEFGVSASLTFPNFFPLPYRLFKGAVPRTDVSASYNYQNRPEYTRNIISTSYGYIGNLHNKFFYQVYPLQLSIVQLSNLDEQFFSQLANDPFLWNAYQNHFDLGSGATLYYTTNTETVPKSSYFYTRLQFDIAGNLLSAFNPLMKQDDLGSRVIWETPYSQYVRGELTLGKTWFFGRKNGQSVAMRLVAGAGHAYGNSRSLPFEKHFYGGGANSLRGWQARSVGPGRDSLETSFVIPNQSGDMKLEFNAEYRFNMFWKVEGAVFGDIGNVWSLVKIDDKEEDLSLFRFKNFGESLAADWGVGVRLNLGFLLIRVDLGMKVHDPSREQKWVNPAQWLKRNNYAIHFGVGYPF